MARTFAIGPQAAVGGCADIPPPPPSYARDRLEDDGGNGTVPTKTSSDYLQCGKHALRNTSSRILVDTIEDAVRQGGVALFSEHFRFDSSIGWVVGDNLTGEIDAVIPLRSGKFPDGKEQALFLQPGAVFWPGLKSENRIDVNLGFAYRQYLAPGFPRLT